MKSKPCMLRGGLFVGTQHQTGQRQYEITDHLGDVLATVSDKRRGIDPGHTGNITNYIASPVALYDYYPFGMLMPGRYVYDTANHCELVTETAPVLTTGTIGVIGLGNWCLPCGWTAFLGGGLSFGGSSMTISGSSAGDGASMDVSTVSGTAYSGSVSASGLTGGSWTATAMDITSSTILAATTIAQPQDANLSFTATGPSTRITLTATAASSTFTVTALPLHFTTWTAGTIVTTVCSKEKDSYLYGFNGKLKDNEWAGIGNSLDYGARMEDTRIARFRSSDPLFKKYPSLTTYQFASNRPIQGVDLDGKEFFNSTTIFSTSGNVAGGLGVGGNAGLIKGTAYDMIGKTYFSAYSAIGPSNQDLADGTDNPQLIVGLEAGVNASVQWVHKPTFSAAFNVMTFSASTVSAKAGLGAGVSVGSGTFGLSGGLGIGGSFKTGNQTVLSKSFSLTSAENKMMVKPLIEEPQAFQVAGLQAIRDKEGTITGWKGQLQVYGAGEDGKEQWHSTGITVESGNVQTTNKSGQVTNKSDNQWKSSEYAKQEAEINSKQ